MSRSQRLPGLQALKALPCPKGDALNITLADYVKQNVDLNRVHEEVEITADGVVSIEARWAAGGQRGTGFIFHVQDGKPYVLTARHEIALLTTL